MVDGPNACAKAKRGSPRTVGGPARFWSAPVFWRFGNGGEPTESARGLAQSKTLPRNPQLQGPHASENTKWGSPRTSVGLDAIEHFARAAGRSRPAEFRVRDDR